MLAAAAVEMTHPNSRTVPPKLLAALELENDKCDLIARFLFDFRRQLHGVKGYAEGIEYADQLNARGLLTGTWETGLDSITE